ncbi:MAG: hypothetical protein A2W90_13105 [Bacteroidetes bacterium GWF2_42_66]|nr:MAG: hypothetical protein A2W92_19385 [Bacteroidetes bacterium GWA2_42_15]OFY00155.1 MAG: hypothetical protein A2W89_18095 [Bacteroidetes bacterium GWE2_42_39]OFY40297.1 MAG: hypothetical protein A2W90_13105 [Bacteroidetes bacterium GWF2_42_66]HBL73718.1 inositol monophosphatase [Prolixibacteraceae bacterium]HCR90728.1 inositol monophosphatase [Prolixibacteraceae bacterium]
MKVAVASKNPVKIEAVREAFSECFFENFDLESFFVSSGVSDQPLGNRETRKGARNRAETLMLQHPGFDYYVGIEGGVSMMKRQMAAFAWMVIKSKENEGTARTASFFLPPRIAELVLIGYELGEADDIVFGQKNSKQDNGAVGLLTNNVVIRKTLYKQAVVLALIPFLSPDMYQKRI